jgi:hypothetical protein
MDQSVLLSGRDTLLIAVPLVLMIFISLFRLDQVIASPKASLQRRRPVCGIDESGEPILRDPDGRLSGPGRRSAKRKK